MDESNKILVIGEIESSSLTQNTKELLAAGRFLADEAGKQLCVTLMGSAVESCSQEAIACGADTVYITNHPLLGKYQPDLYLSSMEQASVKLNPSIILMSRNTNGRELAPRLAARLGVPLAQDCLEVGIQKDSKRMICYRPIHGGNAMAAVVCKSDPQIVSLRPKAYTPAESNNSRKGESVALDVELDDSMVKVKVINWIEDRTEGVQLETAKIVIAGGRGLGGPEPFEDLQALASLMGGAVGASRAVVDSGWVPHPLQIGLTGKSISPDLYITIAISGASQHMAGCSGAKVIVAINKDQQANIFKDSRYGVVGNWQDVLPSFTETIRELLS